MGTSKKRAAYLKNYKAQPWYRAYHRAWNRCNSVGHKNYKYYGLRGIKMNLKPTDCRLMWERDKAEYMRKPSLDRIDPSKNYELANCRFVELSYNIKRRHGNPT